MTALCPECGGTGEVIEVRGDVEVRRWPCSTCREGEHRDAVRAAMDPRVAREGTI